MSKKLVRYNGVMMAEGWPEKIQAAQLDTMYRVLGRAYRRIAYGDEGDDWGADWRPCQDCYVVKGQLHVPGCDVEECAACGNQLLSCACRAKG